jgi:hypothetical protein
MGYLFLKRSLEYEKSNFKYLWFKGKITEGLPKDYQRITGGLSGITGREFKS